MKPNELLRRAIRNHQSQPSTSWRARQRNQEFTFMITMTIKLQLSYQQLRSLLQFALLLMLYLR